MQAGECLHAQVALVRRHRQLGLDRELAGLLHLELEVQRDRGREAVIAGPQVGRRGGHAHHPAPVHDSTASSRTASSASQVTSPKSWSSAVCGSFRPWPVSTQATCSAPSAPYLSSPATEAAEAGSQKTPSALASSR